MSLSVEEKLQFISALWDSMTQNPASFPVPDWQLEELDRRIESQQKKPQRGKPWDQVNREIRDGK
ncbi:MAG: addiction module protein [Planctomycetes bacterium]|nr:addiction module protein [Planctomycetota bacterium]